MMTLFELRKSFEMNKHQTITAGTVARQVGINRSKYWRFEHGQSTPNILEAAKIAAFFNIKLADLVGIVRATREHDAQE